MDFSNASFSVSEKSSSSAFLTADYRPNNASQNDMMMISHTEHGRTAELVLVWAAAVAAVACIWLGLEPFLGHDSPFPKVGRLLPSAWSTFHLHESIREGYQELTKKGSPFYVKFFCRDFLVLPPKYLKDVKRATRESLSFAHPISDVFFISASVGDLLQDVRSVRVVQKGLNPKIPQVTRRVIDELDYAFSSELASHEGGLEVEANKFMSAITLRISSCMVLGREAARQDDLRAHSQKAIQSIFINAMVNLFLPTGPLRPWLIQPITRLLHTYNYQRLIRSMERVIRKRAMTRACRPAEATHDNIVDWTLDLTERELNDLEFRRMAMEITQQLWAATSSPSGILTEMVFMALSEPSYLESMRAEAAKAVDNYGWSEKMIDSLKLQDSFIRETNRIYPTGALTCLRRVMDSSFTFSDGLRLKEGTRFGFSLDAAQQDEDNFDNPLSFDGFRFARLNERDARNEDLVNKWGASNVSTTNLIFGYGNHVCPGRFMGVRLMKMIFTKLILDYDITWERKIGYTPKRVKVEAVFAPNPFQKIKVQPRNRSPA